MSEWKKLLYLRQPYPDNYTDASFLDQLKRNTTVAQYSKSKLINDFSLIAFYGSLLLLVNVNFSAIYLGLWPAHIPTLVSSMLSVVFLALSQSRASGRTLLKLYIVFSMLLLVFSPALRSLTQSTSLDLIWALSFILTCVNVVCHDYALDLKGRYKSIISTNLSFANAIVLASRLLSSASVFSFLVFSLEVSVLVPSFDFGWRKYLSQFHHAALLFVFLAVALLLYLVHGVNFALSYVAGVVLVLVGLPMYFLSLQKYKNELQGPWDVANPILRTQ